MSVRGESGVRVMRVKGVWCEGSEGRWLKQCLFVTFTCVPSVWVKTNQLQRLIRTGRTGHWINHSKEHCLVGVKGNPRVNKGVDCDVIVAEVSGRRFLCTGPPCVLH